uniref:Uncharacterized protein n=2 Tax=Knipowitschia caucasica TaxID=637954 RepID=A0AAV2JI56_KNICA
MTFNEDDERLYSEAFDLEALLTPTPPGGVQEPEPQDILVESIIQPPSPLEESAVVRALREQLREAWAEISSQAEVNKAQELKLQTQQQRADDSAAELLEAKRKLQTTESSFRELTKDFGDIRYLYNKAVSDTANQAKSSAMDTEGLSQRDMSSQTSPEDFVSELQQLKQQLRATQLKLQQEANDFGEMRILFNSAVSDKVTLRQELTSAEKTIVRQKKRLEEQDAVICDLQLKTSDHNCGRACSRSRSKAASIQTTAQEKELNEMKEMTSQEEVFCLIIEKERILKALGRPEEQHGHRPQRPAGVGDQRGASRRCQH